MIIHVKKSWVEAELATEMWVFETEKLKSVMKIAKIKTKKVEHVEDEVTQVVMEIRSIW